MKFWKSLSALIDETLPDWRDNFLSYKELKKQLKLIYPKDGKVSSSTGTGKNPNKRARAESDIQSEAESKCRADSSEVVVVVDKEVTDFVRLLEDEIDKFNAFFVEKEEEYVIKWKELQERAEKEKDSNEELMKVGREIVDFHGEMVLLENYSALNYTGLVKILKKYDKRSGALIRLPFIQKVLQEPFFSTEVIDKLVKECEMMLEKIFFDDDPSSSSYLKNEENGCDSKMAYEAKASQTANDKEACDSHTTSEVKGMEASNCGELYNSKTVAEVIDSLSPVPKDLADNENMESMYKKTLSALRVLKEVRSGSSTVSVFSLPPLHNNGQDGDQKNTDVQQEDK